MRFPLALLAAALVLAFLPLQATAQSDDFRPVVLTGADTPLLIGAAVTQPVCFALNGAVWTQCPLQIDERAWLDRGSAYPQDLNPEFYGIDQTLHYTAPQDYPMPNFTPTVPADPDPTLDANDEVVMMARFFGEQTNLAVNPPPNAPERVQEIEFEGRYAYLYVPLAAYDQSAGYDLVAYTFNLLRGAFPDYYDFSGDHFDRFHKRGHNEGDRLAANPEYSTVVTPHYRTSFEDRWIQRELQFADGSGGYGPDILDRVKYASRPDYPGSASQCGRTIWSGSAARGTLGIQKDGPIRAIRFIQGLNSGGYNNVTYLLYERYLEFSKELAMHQVPGSSMWYDLAPSADGMMYYSNLVPEGRLVDGTPDYEADGEFLGAYIDWDYLIGPQGSMVGVWEKETNVQNLDPDSYYEDASTPAIINCTGDGKAIGNFGNVHYADKPNSPNINIPSTDPREREAYFPNGTLRYFRSTRRAVHTTPNLPTPDADALVVQLKTPVVVVVEDRLVPSGDQLPPVVSGTLDRAAQTFSGEATDSGAGIASVELGSRTNLALAVDPFTTGDASVGFTVTPVNPTQPGMGYVVATDPGGNQDSLYVEVPVPAGDPGPPVLTGSVEGVLYTGSAVDNQLDDTGIAIVTLSAGATNLVLQVDPFTVGTTQPVTFTVLLGNVAASGQGFVVAEDVSGARDSIAVVIEAAPADTNPPVFTATLADLTLTGTVTDAAPLDLGLASVTLDAGASNLDVQIDPYQVGAASVSFEANPVDNSIPAAGTLVAEDLAGNVATYAIDLPAARNDLALRLDRYRYTTETDGDITVWAVNIGSLTMEDVAVQVTRLLNVADATPEKTVLGAIAPGDSVQATFAFTGADATSEIRLRVNDRIIGRGEADFDNNVINVALLPSPQDLQIAGALADRTFNGTAQADTDGLTNLALAADVTNLALTTEPYAAGTTEAVGFTVTPLDDALDARGYVVATDGAGDRDSVLVDIPRVSQDEVAPNLTGTLVADATPRRFDGTATDDRLGDSGLAAVSLGTEAVNLSLTVDLFSPGDATVAFTATPTDGTLAASGYVVATDVAGNTDSLLVDIGPPTSSFPFDLTLTIAYAYDTADSGTITVTALNIGTETMERVRVRMLSQQDVSVSPGQQLVGSLAAGESADATFAFDNAGPAASARFRVQDLDVRVSEEGDPNNNTVDVSLTPVPVGDQTPPALSGTYTADSFDGTATDNGTGIATVAVGAAATNLALTVAPFAVGDATVSFAATPLDAGASASGHVIATDMAGNADSVQVVFDPVAGDVDAPVLTGNYGARDFTGTATDDRAGDSGLASVTLRDAVNMSIAVASFAPGSGSVAYTVTLDDVRAPGEGYVVAVDVAGNESELLVSSAQPVQRAADNATAATDEGGVIGEGRARSSSSEGVAESDEIHSDHRMTGASPENESFTTADASQDVDAGRLEREPSDTASPSARGSDTTASGSRKSPRENREAPPTDGDASAYSLNTSDAAEAPRATPLPQASASVPEVFGANVYPNPGGSQRRLTLEVPVETTVSVTLTDLLGRRVFEHRAPFVPGVHRLDLDFGSVAVGTYVLDVATASTHRALRISVSR